MQQQVKHNPPYYIAGVFDFHNEKWIGDFAATYEELFEYVEWNVNSVAEYELLLCMITSQQIYETWWEKTRKKFN
jgi:hypothetical protein